MKKVLEVLPTVLMAIGLVSILSSFVVLISALLGYLAFGELAFLIPFFTGMFLFFVGMWAEGKYADPNPHYINRKTQMVAAILGGMLSVVMLFLSIFAQ